MSKPPDLREIPNLPQEIQEAALNGDLILFIGAGVSRLVGMPSWDGLAWKVLEDLRQMGCINYSKLDQLNGLDPKKLLSIAELIANENDISLDFSKHLKINEAGSRIYEYLNKIGSSCVTTNYDELLSPRYYPTKDGSTTALSVKRISQKDEFYSNYLNTPGTVIHLHGSISNPKTMVVSTRQYLEHYDDEFVQRFLGELFAKKTILFLGYGLEEAEILEHILRRGRVEETKVKKRFLLHPFFLSEQPLYEMLYNYYSKSFGVYLIGFIRDHNNYNQLEEIIRVWSEQIEVRPSSLTKDLEFMDEVLS